MEVHRGEVFYADLSPVVGSEQGGVRPVLIIQNDIGNKHSPTVICAAGRIPEDDMRRVDEALGVSMGLHDQPVAQSTHMDGGYF